MQSIFIADLRYVVDLIAIATTKSKHWTACTPTIVLAACKLFLSLEDVIQLLMSLI